MSTAVAVGVVVWDLGVLGVAACATAVVLVGSALEDRRLLKGLETEEIPTVILGQEELARHKPHQRLAREHVAEQFDGTNVLMETAKGEVMGFRRLENGSYKLVARHGVHGTHVLAGSTEEVERQLRQQYAYLKVKQEVEKRGYVLVQEERLEDNSIRILARRWD